MFPAAFRPEPRCHVCRTDSIREKVNDLLARGASYAQIARAVRGDGVGEVSLDSVRNHAARHFPVQNAAQATYREIVERRAAQVGLDFIDGVSTAVTPMAFYETLMVKGYEQMVQDGAEVSIETALRAADKLQALAGVRDHEDEILDVHVRQNRIIDAIRRFVPEDKLEDFVAGLGGQEAVQPLRAPVATRENRCADDVEFFEIDDDPDDDHVTEDADDDVELFEFGDDVFDREGDDEF